MLPIVASAADRGGQQGQFAPGPQCKGAPKQCRTCSNRIYSSVTFQSSFFKGLVLLYFRLYLTCSFALTLRRPLARAPYVVFFDLKPLLENGNLQVYMYCVHARKRAPEHTSEHVKSQNFLGACHQTPLTQSILRAPTFCICPGPPQSSQRP